MTRDTAQGSFSCSLRFCVVPRMLARSAKETGVLHELVMRSCASFAGSAKPTVDCWLSRSNVFTDTRPVSHPPLTHHSRPSVGYPSGSARGPVVGCPSVARLRWRQCRPSGGRQHERDGERRAPRRRRQIPRRRPMATVSSRSAGDRRTHLFLVFCLIFQKVLFLRDFFGRDSEIALLS